jgi:hypothetical protein
VCAFTDFDVVASLQRIARLPAAARALRILSESPAQPAHPPATAPAVLTRPVAGDELRPARGGGGRIRLGVPPGAGPQGRTGPLWSLVGGPGLEGGESDSWSEDDGEDT